MNVKLFGLVAISLSLVFMTGINSAFAEPSVSDHYVSIGKPLGHATVSPKVCGAQLCGHDVNAPNISSNTHNLSINVTPVASKDIALKRALEGSQSLSILKSYYAYKGLTFDEGIRASFGTIVNPTEKVIADVVVPITSLPVKEIQESVLEDKNNIVVPINKTNTEPEIDGLFANPTWPTKKTEFKPEPKVAPTPSLPSRIGLFANPDYPVYVKKIQLPVMEIEEIVPEDEIVQDYEPIGICGVGTMIVDGVCTVIDTETESEVEVIETETELETETTSDEIITPDEPETFGDVTLE